MQYSKINMLGHTLVGLIQTATIQLRFGHLSETLDCIYAYNFGCSCFFSARSGSKTSGKYSILLDDRSNPSISYITHELLNSFE